MERGLCFLLPRFHSVPSARAFPLPNLNISYSYHDYYITIFLNMSKRLDGEASGSSTKRKRVSLNIRQKVELLKKLESGVSTKSLCDEYGIGSSTVYDLKKQKEQLLKFYAESDTPKLMEDRKTLHKPRNIDVDQVLMEWIRQRRSEKVPLDRSIIMAQAKNFHEQLKIPTNCEYSAGWFSKFKNRHGLRILSICGEKVSADQEGAEEFVEEFQNLIKEHNLTPEQIYNADETSLFWRYVPRKTYVAPEESAPSGVKDSKERLTVLACSNAAGTHKCKLLIIGKSARPRALKNVKNIPVLYRANKRAWITQDLFTDWFQHHFVPEARSHSISIGLPRDSKILLVLDNCTGHPAAELLEKDHASVVYLPPNCTSLIQPMDQGVLRSLKCRYKSDFLRRLLNSCNSGVGIKEFAKEYSIRDAIFNAANSWDSVSQETLINSWHNLWPATILIDGEDSNMEFSGFRISKEKEITDELMRFARGLPCSEAKAIDEESFRECLIADENAPVVHQLTDGEIAHMVLNPEESESSESEEEVQEKISIDRCLELTNELLRGMEQKSFFTEQDIMSVYKIQEKLLKEKPKNLKQLKLSDMFNKSAAASSS